MSRYKDENGRYIKCTKCKKELDTGLSLCDECREKARQEGLERREIRRQQNKCVSCGIQLENISIIRCNKCMERIKKTRHKKEEYRKANKICVMCGKQIDPRSNAFQCEFCLIKRSNGCTFKKDVSKAHELLTLLIKQNRKCPYTGKELIVGLNATIDHIIPKVQGGSDDIDNLQWVDKNANMMKNGLTHDEFLQTIRQILDYTNELNAVFHDK